MAKEEKDVLPHHLIECQRLIHLPREAIDQESTFAIGPPIARPFSDLSSHGVLNELHGDLGRDDLAIFDAFSNKFAVLRPLSVLFLAEEVASWAGPIRVSVEDEGDKV